VLQLEQIVQSESEILDALFLTDEDKFLYLPQHFLLLVPLLLQEVELAESIFLN
jgi:hypothetical protein